MSDDAPGIGGKGEDDSPRLPRLWKDRRQMATIRITPFPFDVPPCATCDDPNGVYRFAHPPHYCFCPTCASRVDILNGDLAAVLADGITANVITEQAIINRTIFDEWHDQPALQGTELAAVGRINTAAQEMRGALIDALPEWLQRLLPH